ncbi:nocturnin-like isoform X2 [Halichondria panicea]
MLADAMAHGNFVKCPAEVLKWSYRSQLILNEICRSEADIICLEEVDHFLDFFEPHLSRLGFEGLFVPKNDSPCLQYQPNNGPDGCALFFRSSMFALLEKKEFRLKNETQGISNQVALLARLKIEDANKAKDSPFYTLCVGVTHLKAKRDYQALRAAQGEHLLSEMASFASDEHAIICGDFNATPDEPVYQHFTNNKTHQLLNLSSAYAASFNGEKEPPLTSWKFRAYGESEYTIDYIWILKDKMVIDSIWRLPTKEEIGENALPSPSYPSDHLALCSSITLF